MEINNQKNHIIKVKYKPVSSSANKLEDLIKLLANSRNTKSYKTHEPKCDSHKKSRK